jgi:hypothetical protein
MSLSEGPFILNLRTKYKLAGKAAQIANNPISKVGIL